MAGSQQPAQKMFISTGTIVRIFGVAAVALFLWFIRDVLGLLFVAVVLASALDPWVDTLQRYRIPRGVSIIAMYLMLAFLIVFLVTLVIPLIFVQMTEILDLVTSYLPQLDTTWQYITQNADATLVNDIQANFNSFNEYFSSLTAGVFATIQGFFTAVTGFLFVLVITFYIVIDEDGLKKFIRSIAPIQYQPYLVQKTNRVQERMGNWLSGQLVLMAVVGAVTFLGLMLLGVPYALVLALLAGLAEFVPFVGPVLAAIPAVFFAFTESPWLALGVLVFYAILQQVENQILVPMIMKKAVGLSPIVILAVMLVGAKVAGIVGVLLAVPAAVIVWIFLEDVIEEKKKMDTSLE